jgi:hypothetical protein
MDHPAAHHFRVRDRAVHRGLGRFLSTLDRIRSWPCPRSPAYLSGRRRRWAGHDRHAGAVGRGMGVAQLEVPPCRPRGRHDLRPLDADAEAAADRGGRDVDRRLAGRRAHRGRRPVRRGRGGSQGPAPPGREGPPARPRSSGGERRPVNCSPEAAKAPAGRRQRDGRRGSCSGRPAGAGRQARTSCGGSAKAAKAAAIGRFGGARR